EFGCQPDGHQTHRVLGDAVREMTRPEPLRVRTDRWGQREYVRVTGLPQLRNSATGHQERAAGVDVLHQVVTLHVDRLGRREVNGTGIVDHTVDAAELCGRAVDGIGDGVVVTNVAHDRQRVTAGTLDGLGRGMDR